MQLSRTATMWSLLAIAVAPSFGQSPGIQSQAVVPTTQNAKPPAVPRATLYRLFLRYAKARNSSPQKPPTAAPEYVSKAGLNASEAAAVLHAADALDQALNIPDQQARALTTKFKSDVAKAGSIERSQIAAPVAQLRSLQQQRDTLINQHVAALKNQLSPTSRVSLDAYLDSEFASRVTLSPVSIPRDHNPQRSKPEPFIQVGGRQ